MLYLPLLKSLRPAVSTCQTKVTPLTPKGVVRMRLPVAETIALPRAEQNRHRTDLAEAARLVADRDDLDGDVGSLIDPEKLIGIEVGLLGRSARERDTFTHRIAQPENHSRFDRSLGKHRVDGEAGVTDADEPLHLQGGGCSGDLHNHGQPATVEV